MYMYEQQVGGGNGNMDRLRRNFGKLKLPSLSTNSSSLEFNPNLLHVAKFY
jgi:hypothetical protein